jgi:hypothetical protein
VYGLGGQTPGATSKKSSLKTTSKPSASTGSIHSSLTEKSYESAFGALFSQFGFGGIAPKNSSVLFDFLQFVWSQVTSTKISEIKQVRLTSGTACYQLIEIMHKVVLIPGPGTHALCHTKISMVCYIARMKNK